MRNILLLILCLFSSLLPAQENTRTGSDDGVKPLLVGEANETRALIIGISDYKDDGVGDLRFANKDAEIFASYLQSEAGGTLPDVNIWRMTNQEATLGAIDNALDWLIKETKKGDKVIIYFSGHGDVERRTLWQRGYLLTYDTPANNYRNNAVRVEDLDEIIKTLSVGNEAKVVVILDACRSGKLATAGPSLTAEQLEKQVENEVRILSCKPDQKSLESEIWGEGRGLFSFFLVNGMKGLADKGSMPDNIVTFEELKDFVKSNMETALSAPDISARQNPVFVGDETFELATVDEKVLATVNQELSLASAGPSSGAGEGKGVVEKSPDTPTRGKDDALIGFVQATDLSKLAEDPDFKSVVEAADPAGLLRFFTQKLTVDSIKNQLSLEQQTWQASFLAAAERAENDAPLRQQLQQLLAARLHDQVQEVISDYLRGDARELDKRHYTDQAEKYEQYPLMLKAAMQMLPKSHLLYHKVEVKYHYFDGVCTRLASMMSDNPMSQIPEALEKQKMALALDDKAAYIHNELGLLHWMQKDLKTARKHFETAAELAPNWALPLANLCALLIETGDFAKSEEFGKRAMELQPDYFGTYVNLGYLAEKQHDLLKAETLYRKARQLNDPHYLPFERRAYLQLETARYKEADWQFLEMELRKQGTVPPLTVFTVVASPEFIIYPEFEYPSLSGPGVVHKKPKTAEEFFMTGKAYFEQQQPDKAEPFFRQAMRLAPSHPEVFYYLGKICYDQRRYEEAELYFVRLVKLRPEVEFMPFFLADVYRDWHRPAEEEAIYRQFMHQSENEDVLRTAYLSLSKLMNGQGRYPEQELLLWKFFEIDRKPARDALSRFYHSMVELFPHNPDWLYCQANFQYHHAGHALGVWTMKELVKMDSTYPANAFIYARVGKYYLEYGDQPYLNESDERWQNDIPEAIAHLEQSVRLAPTLPTAKYELATAYLLLFRYDEALAVLESLRDSNDLHTASRLQLADLFMRSGRFGEANALLDKAWNIYPEPVVGLPELTGKLHQLQGETAKAIDFYEQATGLEREYDNGSLCYTLARMNARLGKKAGTANWIELAYTNGFRYPRVLKYDPDLDKFRQDADFVALLGKCPEPVGD